MKYRVCRMVDGNGNVWWQVARVVFWFFYEWDRDWTVGVSRLLPKTVNKFDSEADAMQRVEDLKRLDRARMVKVAQVLKPTPVPPPPAVEPAPPVKITSRRKK